jgi:hypothetical protein
MQARECDTLNLLPASDGFLLGLILYPDDGGDMLFRIVGSLIITRHYNPIFCTLRDEKCFCDSVFRT